MLAVFAPLLLALSSCGAHHQKEVLVFAAASLTDVLQEQADLYQRAENTKISLNLGPSTGLAQQILRGAPADVFISAGQQPVDALRKAGALEQKTETSLLRNELVVVARKGKDLKVGSLGDLTSPAIGRIAIADPALAPAGAYAREAFTNLGLWERLSGKLVLGVDVRAALAYVESGNADVALVYQTDAAITYKVRVLLTVPESSHSPIVYPAGVVKKSHDPEAARSFLAFLRSDQGRQTFAKYGFVPVQD